MSQLTDICTICEEGSYTELKNYLSKVDRYLLNKEINNDPDEENPYQYLMNNDAENYNMFELLYEFGFDINKQKDGKTALYYAVIYKNERFMDLLLSENDLSFNNVSGKLSLIEYAVEMDFEKQNFKKIVEIYKNYGASIDFDKVELRTMFTQNYTACSWLNDEKKLSLKAAEYFCMGINNQEMTATIFSDDYKVSLSSRKILFLLLKNDIDVLFAVGKSSEMEKDIKEWIISDTTNYQKKKIKRAMKTDGVQYNTNKNRI